MDGAYSARTTSPVLTKPQMVLPPIPTGRVPKGAPFKVKSDYQLTADSPFLGWHIPLSPAQSECFSIRSFGVSALGTAFLMRRRMR